jgi:hypothetical protein
MPANNSTIVTDLIPIIISAFTLFQVIVAFIIIRIIDHRNLQLKIMQDCIDQYRKIVNGKAISEDNVHAFLEIINEEIYYLEKGFIPKDIESEWLTNMINYLPIFSFDKKNKVNFNSPVNSKILECRDSIFAKKEWLEQLIPYPRIIKLIVINMKVEKISVSDTIDQEYKDFAKINKWKENIKKEMIKNMNKNRFLKIKNCIGL